MLLSKSLCFSQSFILDILHFTWLTALSVWREHKGRWLNSPESRKPAGCVGVWGSDPWTEISKARTSWLDSYSHVPAWNSFKVSEHLSSVWIWPDKPCPLQVVWVLLSHTFLFGQINSFWQTTILSQNFLSVLLQTNLLCNKKAQW